MKGWFFFLGALVVIVGVVGFVVQDSGDYSSPQATVETMIEAAKANDQDAIKRCFTEETQNYLKQVEEFGKQMGGGCAPNQGMIASQFKGNNPVFGAERITGNTATLEATVNGSMDQIYFQKEGDDWKITIPELKPAIQMMKGMGGNMQEVMEGMANQMADALEESMDEMTGEFEEMMEQMEEMNQ